MSFRPVYKQLHELLTCSSELNEEDLTILFEALVMSYFSRYADPPQKVFSNVLNLVGYNDDYIEQYLGEAALAILETICLMAQTHFPQCGKGWLSDMYGEATLAEKLHITNAYMQGRDHLVISMPLHIFQQLQHEIPHDSSTHPA